MPANLTEDFAQTLVDCRQLYLRAGRQCCREAPQWGDKSPRELMQWMDDLHRGLLIKVYMEVALADLSWHSAERQLAQHLFEHLWGRRLEGAALREAAQGLHQRAQHLSFRGVVQPFLEVDVLREHGCALATIVMRLANLVAKADGVLSEAESGRIHRLQETFGRMFDQASKTSTARPLRGEQSQQVMQRWEQDAAQIRDASSSPIDGRPGSESPGSKSPSDASLGSDEDEQVSPEQRLAEAMDKLHALTGLEAVKTEVQMLTNFLKVQQQRQKAGLPATPLTLHLVFTGNPGTGKTTVARIIGQIFGAMGVLKKGHLVETDRSGLVADYAGQTATKTNKLVDQALDGVLFIDEAYSLVSEDAEDAFGREALQVLLKRMEDDRDRLAVILAGYPEPMDRLLKSNPGLSSRFGRTLSFDDYDCVELARIFEFLCEQNHYVLCQEVRGRLLVGLKWLHNHRDEHFGNGRLVRNLFEDAIRQLANRIADVTPLTRELLTEFHCHDLPFRKVPADLWMRHPIESTRFETECPGCQRRRVLSGEMLGRRVRCPACKETFTVSWADPVLSSL